MNKIALLIGVLLIVGIGGFVFLQNSERILETSDAIEEVASLEKNEKSEVATTPANETAGEETETPSIGAIGIFASEVAQHNSRESCWSTINGSVYDLTSWVPNHPGGEEAILKLCGRDGSEKFNDKHGGAQQQATVLAGFKIGAATQ